MALVRGYGICTVACPAFKIWIAPPHMQFNLHVLSSAGMLAIRTVVLPPGIHGATVAGIHGAGVGTPNAADVAAMTAGFDGAEHMPKGMTLTIG